MASMVIHSMTVCYSQCEYICLEHCAVPTWHVSASWCEYNCAVTTWHASATWCEYKCPECCAVPTWHARITQQLKSAVLQDGVHIVHGVCLSFLRSKADRVFSESGFRCEQLQHVDGACPMTGPIGTPDCLGLKAGDCEKDDAAGLLKYSVRRLGFRGSLRTS